MIYPRPSHFLIVFKMALLSLGLALVLGCHRFQEKFSRLGFKCGDFAGQSIDTDRNFIVRLMDVDGKISQPDKFRAERIRSHGSREELRRSSKGCLLVPKADTEGIRAWSGESLSFASTDLSELLANHALSEIQTMKLQRLPKLSGKVDCHDKTVWTKQSFASTLLQLGLAGEDSAASLKDVVSFLPALEMDLTIRSNTNLVFSNKMVTGVGLRQLALTNDSLRFDFQVPKEEESQVEVQIKDVFERSIVSAESKCRIKSTRKAPPLILGYEEPDQITLPLYSKLDIGVPAGLQLKMQVQVIKLGEKIRRWEQLTEAEQDNSRREFTIQPSLRFINPGTYIVRAFSEDPAGNQSDVWDRLVHVPEGYKHDNQWDDFSWFIPNFGPRGELALFSVREMVLQGGLKSSVVYPEQGGRNLPEQDLNWTASSFFKNNLQDRSLKLIHGNFGIKGRTGLQICLLFGPHADELAKTGRNGAIICAERVGEDRMETLLELPFTSLLADQELTTIDLDSDGLDDFVSFSSQLGLTKYWTFINDELKQKTNLVDSGGLSQGFPSVQKVFAFLRYRSASDSSLGIPDVIVFDPKSDVLAYSYLTGVQTAPGHFGHWWAYTVSNNRFGSFERLMLRLEPSPQEKLQYWIGKMTSPRTFMQVTEAFGLGESIVSLYDSMDGRYRFWERFVLPGQDPGLLPSDRITGKGLDVDRSKHCFFYRSQLNSTAGLPRCLAFANDQRSRNALAFYSYNGEQWQQTGTAAVKQEQDFGELPKPIGGIVRLARQQAFELRGDGIHQLQWELRPLRVGQDMPDKTNRGDTLVEGTRFGEGPLLLWGSDERFAVFFRYKDGQDGLSSAWQKRDVRFPITVARNHNLSKRLGWADLDQDGQPELIEPGSEPGSWKLRSLHPPARFDATKLVLQAEWPSFVNSKLGWNSRLISVVSGRFLGRDLANLFCYIAHQTMPSPKIPGSIACYRLVTEENSKRLVKQFEKELNIAENEQVFTFDTSGDDRTVIGAFNFNSFSFQTYALSDSGVFASKPLIMALRGFPSCVPTFPASLATSAMSQNPGETNYVVVANNPSGGRPLLYMFNSFSTGMVAKPLYKLADRYCMDDDSIFYTSYAVFFENKGLHVDPLTDMNAANFVQSFPASSMKISDLSQTGGAIINSGSEPRIWTGFAESYKSTFPLAATHTPFYYMSYSDLLKSDEMQVLAMPNIDQDQQTWITLRYDLGSQKWVELSRF